MAPQNQQGAPAVPPGPALFPASLAQGLSLMLSQLQMGAQVFVNQQAQTVQMFSKSAQQAQVNFLNMANQMLVGPAAQMARPPLIPLQAIGKGGEGFAPTGFFPEWQPEAVKQKTQKEVPYHPLTEGQRDFSKGGFTESPQQEIPHPSPKPAAKRVTAPLF
jgi:hypothetical protein